MKRKHARSGIKSKIDNVTRDLHLIIYVTREFILSFPKNFNISLQPCTLKKRDLMFPFDVREV